MIILVCGGRDFSDYACVCAHLDRCGDVDMVIQGGARGADALAKRWAKERRIHCAQVDAMWNRADGSTDYGAGPKRNRAMLLLKPDGVVAFPGGSGTRDMVEAARAAGVDVWEIA